MCGIFLCLGLAFLASIVKGELLTEAISTPEAQREAAKTRDVSFDPQNLPTIAKDVDYRQGNKAPGGPKGESPLLKDLVQGGKIDPVEKRVGPEPSSYRRMAALGSMVEHGFALPAPMATPT